MKTITTTSLLLLVLLVQVNSQAFNISALLGDNPMFNLLTGNNGTGVTNSTGTGNFDFLFNPPTTGTIGIGSNLGNNNCTNGMVPVNGVCQCPPGTRLVIFICQPINGNNGTQGSSPFLRMRNLNRSYDGSGNNAANPRLGATGENLVRTVPANYADSFGTPVTNRPNPRSVSNTVGEMSSTFTLNRFGLNMLFPLFGQYLDHDITLTP